MMMLSKLSIVSTMAALLFSFNASAMSEEDQDQEQGKCAKKEKSCLEEECDQDQFEEKCDKDQSQDIISCSSSLSQAGQSQVSCSSQQSCGATVQQDSCEFVKDSRWLQKGHKSAGQLWFNKIKAAGLVGTRVDWTQSKWTAMGSKNVKLERIALNNSVLDNVNLTGKFNHVHFDDGTISNSTFSGKFSDTDFAGAKLTNVLFINAKFEKHHEHVPVLGRRSNFDNATMEGVQFVASELGDMTFRDAHLKDVTFPCSKIKVTTCFADANVWNPASQRWVKLSGKALKQLGVHMSKCQEGAINLSAWLHTHHPEW